MALTPSSDINIEKQEAPRLDASTVEMLKILIGEMKKPDEETYEKQQRDKSRRAEIRAQEIRAAWQAECTKIAGQNNCNHFMNGGQPGPMGQMIAIVGIVHNDGMVHPLCNQCMRMGKPFPATDQHRTEGVKFVRIPHDMMEPLPFPPEPRV